MTLLPIARTTDFPHEGNKIFITDGGLETTLIFEKNFDLPLFAAFHLLNTQEGIEGLRDYYQNYIDIARQNEFGLLLDTPTWRASAGWGRQLGYQPEDIQRFNESSVSLLQQIRQEYETNSCPMLINGVIGPQDDGYHPTQILSADEAEQYHCHQVGVLANSKADMITAVTMTYVDEAVGIARAANKAGIPVAISFTVETDGLLPDGGTLAEAINAVDRATNSTPVYYMINCAHPSHFMPVLEKDAGWMDRIVGIRANASCRSHAELDEAVELDDGNPVEFGQSYAQLNTMFKNLRVFGGCCGTDHRHINEVCKSLTVSEEKHNFAA